MQIMQPYSASYVKYALLYISIIRDSSLVMSSDKTRI